MYLQTMRSTGQFFPVSKHFVVFDTFCRVRPENIGLSKIHDVGFI